MDKKEVNALKSKLEEKSQAINLKEQNFLDLENQAKEKFESDIKGYVHHKNYSNIKEYIKMITDINTKINCLVVESEQGIGKTTIVKNILKQLKKDVLYVNSYTTSLAFYRAVYHNKYKHIILDDVYGLYNDEKGISILRALTNTERVRYIKYQSTSDKLDVPSSFVFEGSITILTNKLTDEMDNSLIGRAIHRKIYFTLKEKLEFVEQIINFQYNLSEIDIREITDFLKNNVDNTIKNFTFRSALKITEFYKHNKENWKELALEELEKDEMLIFIKELIAKHKEVKKQVEEFIELTGKHRATFFRLKKKLNEKSQSRIVAEV